MKNNKIDSLIFFFFIICISINNKINARLENKNEFKEINNEYNVQEELNKIVVILLNYIIRNQYIPEASKLSNEVKKNIINKIINDQEILKIVSPIIENNMLLERLFIRNNKYQVLLNKINNGSLISLSLSNIGISILALFNYIISNNNENIKITKLGKIAFSFLAASSLMSLYCMSSKHNLDSEFKELSYIEDMQQKDKEQVNNYLVQKICNELESAVHTISQ